MRHLIIFILFPLFMNAQIVLKSDYSKDLNHRNVVDGSTEHDDIAKVGFGYIYKVGKNQHEVNSYAQWGYKRSAFKHSLEVGIESFYNIRPLYKHVFFRSFVAVQPGMKVIYQIAPEKAFCKVGGRFVFNANNEMNIHFGMFTDVEGMKKRKMTKEFAIGFTYNLFRKKLPQA